VISKVHHCMVDGVAGTDLMQVLFDLAPDAPHSEPQPWTPQREPSTLSLLTGALQDTVVHPLAQVARVPGLGRLASLPGDVARGGAAVASAIGEAVPALARQLATPVARILNGPIGPHRRWAWSEADLDEIKRVRAALGGTVNDVVLTAITRGFRDLLEARGALTDRLVVRSMVPVSVRQEGERGSLDNRVSAVFVDLPVAEPDPLARLADLRRQMGEHKRVLQAVDARSIIALGDFAAPTLMALGTRAAVRAGQQWSQAVTTNVPGPRVPLYLMGRRMISSHAYVPIAAGTRISIGIFSYLTSMTFGINVDFDSFPDVDVLAEGIRRGLDELAELAGREQVAAST
jgi:WS/DGAT/MGAT family acyltransferase